MLLIESPVSHERFWIDADVDAGDQVTDPSDNTFVLAAWDVLIGWMPTNR